MQAEAGTAGFVDAQRQEALALREAHHRREAAIYADEALTRDAKREQGARVREEAEADLAELRQVHERQRQAEADRLGALAFGGEGTGPAGVRSAFDSLAALDTAEEVAARVMALPGDLDLTVAAARLAATRPGPDARIIEDAIAVTRGDAACDALARRRAILAPPSTLDRIMDPYRPHPANMDARAI